MGCAGADMNMVNLANHGEDSQLEELVSLAEAQAEQIDAAKMRVAELESLLARRSLLSDVALAEIRTPLVEAWNALATAHIEDPVQAVPVTAAADELRRALALLDSMGRRPPSSPEPTPRAAVREISVHAVLDAVVAEVRSRHAGGDRHHVVIDTSPDLTVHTSPDRLIGVLVAIADNAFRHGRPPIHLRATAAGGDGLRFEVFDHGAGFRAASALPRQTSGRTGASRRDHEGVGLFVARLMAHTLGGRITAADRLGSGAIVTLLLPQRRQDEVRTSEPVSGRSPQLV